MTDQTKSFSGCPDIEALAAAPSKPEIARHLESCAHCRTELALYQSFENDQPRPEELASVEWIEAQLRRTVPAPSTPWDRLRAWWQSALPKLRPAYALAAASLMIVVIAGVALRQGAPPASPGHVVMRSNRFDALAPAGDIYQPPAEFKWEAVAAAASYHVELLLVDRSVLWSAVSTETSIEIPVAIRAQLVPGRAFQWRVAARDSAGQPAGATDLQTFHILLTRP